MLLYLEVSNCVAADAVMNYLFIDMLYLEEHMSVPVWLSGGALRQQRKRLWVRFPGNTCTNKNV